MATVQQNPRKACAAPMLAPRPTEGTAGPKLLDQLRKEDLREICEMSRNLLVQKETVCASRLIQTV